jgi:CHRD domain
MRRGRVTHIPRPLSIAVAAITAFAAAILMTGVVNAAIVTFTADLTAEAEVPNPGPDGATGSAVITVDDETNEVCFELTIDGIGQDTVIAAHIHEGEAGVAGDVVVPLFTEPPTGEMTGCVQDVDADLLAAIIADPAAYYVNIHTEGFPDGAVRGQLVVSVVGGGCTITVEPATVADGGQVTVSGDFGGAEVHFVQGENASVPEDSEPVATTPADQASFSVTITMLPGSVGTWTVWGFIEGSECGDSAILTVTAATVPNTAARPDTLPVAEVLGALLLTLGAASVLRLKRATIR